MAAGVGEGERPNALEPSKHVRPPLPVGIKQHFRIGMIGAESMPRCLQVSAKIPVIVDVAVVGDRQQAILGQHWLLAVSQIDDGQNTVTKENATRLIDPKTFAVWATMAEAHGHPR